MSVLGLLMSRGQSVNSMGRGDLTVGDVREEPRSEPRVPHLRMSTCCMYRWLWSLHLIIICLLEYVQEMSSQGETQWKAVSKAFLGRFSGLIENHHSCIPALKVTGSAVAALWYIVPCASSWTQFLNLVNLQTTHSYHRITSHLANVLCVSSSHLLFELFVFFV